jgi:hypothetical protein
MTWAALLLSDPSPCLRKLVLEELLHRPDGDPEVRELTKLRDKDSVSSQLLRSQLDDGSWKATLVSGGASSERINSTSRALTTLSFLGYDSDHPAIKRGAEYIFSRQRHDGSWPLPGIWENEEPTGKGYTMIPLQTAIPLRGIAACGLALDPRAERAYEWLLSQVLEDGAWPTGKAGEVYGGVAGYRRLPHSRWGCRSNTTASLLCLARHPTRRTSSEARRALDMLIARETRERFELGFEVARIIGVEQARGFLTYHARFDLALILDLCWRVGADKSDDRVRELVEYVRKQQGAYGLWEYLPHPEVSRWVTFDILRSLGRLDKSTDWLTMEPRTPFRTYPKRTKRY